MKVLKKFSAFYQGKDIVVFFGIPDNDQEKEGMFKLRYQVYKDRNYIDTGKYEDGIEKDNFDLQGKCDYFIAKYEDRVIGTIRLIKDDILPTELDFSFTEPDEIKTVDRANRAELGRYIMIPPNKEKKIFMPRGVSMLAMFHMLSEYALEQGILGGYSFIKSKLECKMAKRKFPFHKIHNYHLNITKDNDLYNYFSDPSDPVIPIYYFTKEFLVYTQKLLNNKLVFKLEGGDIILKNNIYTRMLAFFKYI